MPKNKIEVIECFFTEHDLQIIYDVINDHVQTKLGRPLLEKIEKFVADYRTKRET